MSHTQAQTEWKDEQRAVTLTNEDWNSLTCYLLMTTQYREGERDTWRKLAEETDDSGNPVYKNARKNADFWQRQIELVERVRSAIDGF